MSPDELRRLENDGILYKHHTSTRLGYVSRKSSGIVNHYSGRFGIGYTLDEPRFDTTKYINRTYYIYK